MSPWSDPEYAKEYYRAYHQKNKEKKCKASKEWREKNKEKRAEYEKEYKEKNKEKLREKNLSYKQKHKERIKQQNKEYYSRPEVIEQKKQWEKNYREENRQKLSQKKKEWYENNKEKILEKRKLYRQENKEKINEYYNKRCQNDIQFKLSRRLRSRLGNAIKNNYKSGSAIADLGCTIEELKVYLENQFQEGMTWENWTNDGWHIDHKKPLASFDLEDKEQLKKACHYTNLQPLWWHVNISKRDKLDYGGV